MGDYNNTSGSNKRRNNLILFSIAGILLIAIVIILVVSASGDSEYENGNVALKEQKFEEALVYYQRVDPDDKEYRLAQSRINYIRGMKAYNQGIMDEARVYLAKVEPSDEYYQGAQLLLEKLTRPAAELNKIDTVISRTDTVIIKDNTKVIEKKKTQTEKDVEEKDPPVVDEKAESIKYVSTVQRSINSFQTLYQSAYNGDVEAKRSIVNKLNSEAGKLNAIPASAPLNSPEVQELKKIINMWTSKRIEFINAAIAENSVRETNTTRSMKEEGDKLYNMMQNQLKQVRRLYGM